MKVICLRLYFSFVFFILLLSAGCGSRNQRQSSGVTDWKDTPGNAGKASLPRAAGAADKGTQNAAFTSPPHGAPHVIPAGTAFRIRTLESVDSERIFLGAFIIAMVDDDVRGHDGETLIPAGSYATLVVRTATTRGAGEPLLALALSTVEVAGDHYVIQAPNGKEGPYVILHRTDSAAATRSPEQASVHIMRNTDLELKSDVAITMR